MSDAKDENAIGLGVVENQVRLVAKGARTLPEFLAFAREIRIVRQHREACFQPRGIALCLHGAELLDTK